MLKEKSVIETKTHEILWDFVIKTDQKTEPRVY